MKNWENTKELLKTFSRNISKMEENQKEKELKILKKLETFKRKKRIIFKKMYKTIKIRKN